MSQVILFIAEAQFMFIMLGSFLITLHIFDGSDFAFFAFKYYLVFSILSFVIYLWGDYLSKEIEYEEEFGDD